MKPNFFNTNPNEKKGEEKKAGQNFMGQSNSTTMGNLSSTIERLSYKTYVINIIYHHILKKIWGLSINNW